MARPNYNTMHCITKALVNQFISDLINEQDNKQTISLDHLPRRSGDDYAQIMADNLKGFTNTNNPLPTKSQIIGLNPTVSGTLLNYLRTSISSNNQLVPEKLLKGYGCDYCINDTCDCNGGDCNCDDGNCSYDCYCNSYECGGGNYCPDWPCDCDCNGHNWTCLCDTDWSYDSRGTKVGECLID